MNFIRHRSLTEKQRLGASERRDFTVTANFTRTWKCASNYLAFGPIYFPRAWEFWDFMISGGCGIRMKMGLIQRPRQGNQMHGIKDGAEEFGLLHLIWLSCQLRPPTLLKARWGILGWDI